MSTYVCSPRMIIADVLNIKSLKDFNIQHHIKIINEKGLIAWLHKNNQTMDSLCNRFNTVLNLRHKITHIEVDMSNNYIHDDENEMVDWKHLREPRNKPTK